MGTPTELWLELVRRSAPSAVRQHPMGEDEPLPTVREDGAHLASATRRRGDLSVRELVRPGRRWLLLGPAGTGKSDLLWHVAYTLATHHGLALPVIASLRDLATTGQHPSDWAQSHLARFVGSRRASGLAGTIDELARHGALCLILDDAHKVPESDRNAVLLTIAEWAHERSGPTFIIADRLDHQSWIPTEFSRLLLDPGTTMERYRRRLVLGLSRAGGMTRVEAVLPPQEATSEHVSQRKEPDGASTARGRVRAASTALQTWFEPELDTPLLLDSLRVIASTRDEPTRPQVYRRAMDEFVRSRLDPGAAAVARRALGEALLSPGFSEPAVPSVWRARFAAAVGPGESHGFAAIARSSHEVWDSVTRRSGLLHTADDPASRSACWEIVQRGHKETLLAEALASQGPAAIAAWAGHISGNNAERDSLQSGVESHRVIGLACAWSSSPWEALDKVAEADPFAAVKALADVAPSAPDRAVAFLLSPSSHVKGRLVWDGDDLLALLALHPAGGRSAGTIGHGLRQALWARVTNTLGIDHAARIYYALAHEDPVAAWARFFADGGYRPPGVVERSAFSILRAGDFTMGSEVEEIRRFWRREARSDLTLEDIIERELPATREVISQPFGLARFPVTNAEFRRFDPDHAGDEDGARPVVGLDWWTAHFYAAWTGARLPTEREWEYACRAGTRTAWWCGDDPDRLKEIAVFGLSEDARPRPRQASLPANDWGLCDMHGNVWEWCHDPWQVGRDSPPQTRLRIARGGSYGEQQAAWLRSASRSKGPPSLRWSQLGFRLALNV